MKFFFLQCSQCVIEQVIKINLKKISVVTLSIFNSTKAALWHSRKNIKFWWTLRSYQTVCNIYMNIWKRRISFHKFLWHFISSDKHTWVHPKKNWFKIEFNFSGRSSRKKNEIFGSFYHPEKLSLASFYFQNYLIFFSRDSHWLCLHIHGGYC